MAVSIVPCHCVHFIFAYCLQNYESMRKKQGYELLAEDQNLSNSNTNEPSLTSVGDEPDQVSVFGHYIKFVCLV